MNKCAKISAVIENACMNIRLLFSLSGGVTILPHNKKWHYCYINIGKLALRHCCHFPEIDICA